MKWIKLWAGDETHFFNLDNIKHISYKQEDIEIGRNVVYIDGRLYHFPPRAVAKIMERYRNDRNFDSIETAEPERIHK